MNPYRVLGVNPSDTDEMIRDAYRRYAATHHPDRGGDAATFRHGVEAFRLLGERPPPVRGSLGTHHRANPLVGPLVGLVRRWTRVRRRRRVL